MNNLCGEYEESRHCCRHCRHQYPSRCKVFDEPYFFVGGRMEVIQQSFHTGIKELCCPYQANGEHHCHPLLPAQVHTGACKQYSYGSHEVNPGIVLMPHQLPQSIEGITKTGDPFFDRKFFFLHGSTDKFRNRFFLPPISTKTPHR